MSGYYIIFLNNARITSKGKSLEDSLAFVLTLNALNKGVNKSQLKKISLNLVLTEDLRFQVLRE